MSKRGSERTLLQKAKKTCERVTSKPELFVDKVTERVPRRSAVLHCEEYCTVYRLRHNLNEISDLLGVGQEIDNAFDLMLSSQIDNANDMDQVAVSLRHSSLNKNIWVAYKQKKDYDREALLNKIYKVSVAYYLSLR